MSPIRKAASVLRASPWLLLAVCLHASAQPAESLEELCAHDRLALMQLDEAAFDQDPDGGWRELAKISDCYPVAAELIRLYRLVNESDSTTLAWHEGQLRAYMGENLQAMMLFNQARHANDLTGWNSYVDASIAFLDRDREALLQARERLAAVPKPAMVWRDSNGNPIDISWPPNLNVVDRLIRCFDESYAHAYGRCAGAE